MGLDVTLFATGDSQTNAKLVAVCPCPYSEDHSVDPKVAECLHISEIFERAAEFDLIHNHFDFLPLTYSGLVDTPVLTTIHGFSSPAIMPVYSKYNARSNYVSISDSDRSNFHSWAPRESISCSLVGSIRTRAYTRQFKWRNAPESSW
jgi:hypothetical protein